MPITGLAILEMMVCMPYDMDDSSYKYIYTLYQDQEEANKQQLAAMGRDDKELKRQIEDKYRGKEEKNRQKRMKEFNIIEVKEKPVSLSEIGKSGGIDSTRRINEKQNPQER